MSPIKDRDHLKLYHDLKMLNYGFCTLPFNEQIGLVILCTGNVCHPGRFPEVGAVDGEKLGQDGLDEEEEEGKGEV